MKLTVKKIIKGYRYLKHYGPREFLVRMKEKMQPETVPYEPWYERHRADEKQLEAQRKAALSWRDGPLLSVVVPLYRTPEPFLRAMIASVTAQSYQKWELCLADGSPDNELSQIIQAVAKEDGRIIYRKLDGNLGIAGNTNAAIAMAQGDYIAFLDHDDLLAPDALYEAAFLIREKKRKKAQPEASPLHKASGDFGEAPYDLIYTDEDKVDAQGQRHFQPHFKPDINIDLLRSNNYITHFLIVRKEILEKAGPVRSEFEGAQDYDLILRCVEQSQKIGHIPRILYHWRTHELSTSDNPFSKQYAVDAGKRAIEAHLARMGQAAFVSETKDMGFYKVRYQITEKPLISVIIPNRNEAESLKKCLDSLQKSDYTNYEVIIVENNSNEDTFRFYQSLAAEEKTGRAYRPAGGDVEIMPFTREGKLPGGQRICVADYTKTCSSTGKKEGFHYSRLNNFGVSQARGSYLVLMNNDIELIGEESLSVMLGSCSRSEVGVVGAKLCYPDHTIQHAGIIVGMGGNARGIADNLFAGMPGAQGGYLHKASLQMDYSAVTAALLMTKTEVYHAVGGLTEALAVAFNDVDYCLKVRELGYLVVYNPDVLAIHYESKSRGLEDSPEKVERFQREIEYMRTRWISILKYGDPYYNPNLSNIYNNYTIKDNR